MANVSLTINAEDIRELLAQLRSLAIPAGMVVTVQEKAVVTPAADHVQPTTEAKLDKALDKAIDEVVRTEAAVAEAKPKRGRPAKADAAPVQEHGTLLEAPITADQAKDTIFAEAKQALSDYVANNKENGREKAIDMLKALGAARLTELDASGLQKFIMLIKG